MPPFPSLARIFAGHASSQPEAPALVLSGQAFSYAVMDDLARRWAQAIISSVPGPVQRIGIFASRSQIAYAGVLAALYSGATFVPLNPRFPLDRTRRMIEAAQLDAILVDSLGFAQIPTLQQQLPHLPLLFLPDQLAALQSGPRLEALPDFEPSQIAYLLFTSGSTGIPKGVPISHANLRAYLDWALNRYQFLPSDRFSQTFDQTFDLSVHDQFLCWESGAALYPPAPAELLAPSRFIQRNELTVWFSVPSIVAQMRKRNTLLPNSFPSLRWSLFCGEPLPLLSAEAWQLAAPASTVENLYGPTELTIACAVHRFDPQTSPSLARNGMLSIGAPFPSMTARLVNETLAPATDPTQPGELCFAGPQAFAGYWNDPAKTAAAFLDFPDGRFYRTGDLAIQLPNGEYACLGRADHQVKVLGFRVELGEIEAVLQAEPRVVQAVALPWPFSEGTAQGIVAFVAGQQLDIDALRARCQASLPSYMVPSAIHPLAEMPLNANGKVDRPALAARLASS